MTASALLRGLVTLAFAVSLGFLGIVAGAATMQYRLFPYSYLKALFVEINLARRSLAERSDLLWRPARGDAVGVSRYQPDKAWPGLTLVSSADAQAAALIDMAGRVVHQWRRPYSDVWAAGGAVDEPLADRFVHWRAVHPYPNGDLLVVFEAPDDTLPGYGLAKLDKDSNVLWADLRRVHDDVAVGADGRVYTLVQRQRDTEILGIEQLKPLIVEDYVAVLSADGERVKTFSVIEAFRDSDYAGVLENIPVTGAGVDLRVNAIDVADDGQVLVSLRNVDTVALIDVDAEVVTWAFRGPWSLQNDARVLPGGTMLVFDNRGHFGPGGRSRVIEFDPASQAKVWTYAGSDTDPLESLERGGQQRLANGNTLITESDRGRIIEVTPAGEIVWEYLNPRRAANDNRLVAVVSPARRVDVDWFDFAFADDNISLRD